MNRNKPGNRNLDLDGKGGLLHELDQLQSHEPVPDTEPPRLVDQAVRNMARRELQQRPAVFTGGKLRWIAGLSTVSVALIAVGISMVQSPPSSPGLPPAAPPVLQSEKPEARDGTRQESSRGKERSVKPAASDYARSAERQAGADQANSTSSADAASPPAAVLLKQQAGESSLAKPSSAESSSDGMPEAEVFESALADSASDRDEARAEPTSADSANPGSASPESAQAWLDLIRQLYDQGLLPEATEQLRAFTSDYPDFPLPDWTEELQP